MKVIDFRCPQCSAAEGVSCANPIDFTRPHASHIVSVLDYHHAKRVDAALEALSASMMVMVNELTKQRAGK